MENTESLRDLLHKYFQGELGDEELRSFKAMIDKESDTTLKRELELIWEGENEVMMTMNPRRKSDILRSIHHVIDMPSTIGMKKPFNWWRVAAIIMMPLLVASLSLWFMDGRESFLSEVQEYTVLSGKGQKNQVLLPDGTHVWLNSESEISYNSDFNQTHRNIRLKGEAFFDVKRNEHIPFNVEVDSVDIQVLGTAFDVSAYADDPDIKVSLERGKVEVRTHGDKSFLAALNPNEQVTIDKERMTTTIVDCEAYTESIWRQNVLKISNLHTSEMMKRLERWYGVHIHVRNMPVSKRYGLTIKGESLREMLELINSITPISYRIEGEEVTITYK